MKSRPRLLTLLLPLLAGPLVAQEQAPVGHALSEARRELSERTRDELHPSDDPMVVVGHEQGDNDLRKRTPALARSDRVAATIDPEAAHERALALYSEGAKFHAAPISRQSRPVEPEPRQAVRTQASALAREELAPWWHSALPVFLVASLVLMFFYRRHGRTLRWRDAAS